MNKFIKNSFLTLLKYKAILILLFVFSLLASVLFLTYANSKKGYLDEYNKICRDGNLADVNIYQNYDYSFLIKARRHDQTTSFDPEPNHGSVADEKACWDFSFDRASNYVKFATRLSPKSFPIDPDSSSPKYFRPDLTNCTWSEWLTQPELAGYIKQKSDLFLSELQNDQRSKVATFVNFAVLLLHKRWYHHDVNSLNLTFGQSRYNIIQSDQFPNGVNDPNNLNRLVYYYGSNEQLFPKRDSAVREQNDFNLSFANFANAFNDIKQNIGLRSIQKYPAKYLDFYQALFANFSYTDRFPNAKAILQKLIEIYQQPNHQQDQVVNDLETNDLDCFFQNASISDPTLIGQRNQITITVRSSTTNQPTVITNPLAYQTVISTANIFHGHYRYSKWAYWEWEKFLADPSGVQYNAEAIKNKLAALYHDYPNSFVFVGHDQEVPFFIVGAGISPNYVFPLMDGGFDRNFNNFNRRIFMYTTPAGRDRIKQTYPLKTVSTDVLYAKFPQMSLKQIGMLIYFMNEYAKQFMNTFGRDSAYYSKDVRGLNRTAAFRVLFLPILTDKLTSIVNYASLVILILTTIIAFFVTKNMIDQNHHMISIFNSNGFPLIKLITSFILVLIVPTFLGCFVGFLTSIFAQKVMNLLLGQLWFCVNPPIVINWSDFFASIIGFNAALAFFLFIVGMFLTKKNLVNSLKNDFNYKCSRLELFVKRTVFFAPIMVRFRASIAANAIWKMLILTAMIAATSVTFGLSASTMGKFALAKQEIVNEDHFGYAFDLQTPSIRTGPISYTDMCHLGAYADGFSNKANDLTGLESWRNLQFSSENTFDNYHNNLLFLKDVVTSQFQTDQLIFDDNNKTTFNMWNVLKGMLSPKEQSASDHSYQKVMKYLVEQSGSSKYIKYNSTTGGYELTDAAFEIKPPHRVGISCDYACFLKEHFFEKQAVLNKQQIGTSPIVFNTIVLDPQVIGNRKFVDSTNRYEPPQYGYLRVFCEEGPNIFGIQRNDLNDPNYLGPKLYLTSGPSDQPANDLLFGSTGDANDPVYPVIVNQRIASKFALRVGSIWPVHPWNNYERIPESYYPPTAFHPNPKTPITKLKVVGICRTSKNPYAYLSYENANKILGFPTNKDDTPYYFNGFYTSSNDPLDFKQKILSLFSPSGLYPSTPSFDNNFSEIIRNAIRKGSTDELKQLERSLCDKVDEVLDPDKADQYTQRLKEFYVTPYVLTWRATFSCEDNLHDFDLIAFATSTFLLIAALIAMFISFFIVILIFVISTNNLKNIGIRLQVFGYNSTKVLITILSICLPALVLGIGISYPLMIYAGHVFRNYFFNLVGIVLPLSPPLFGLIVGGSVAVILLMISFGISYWLFSRINLANAIKGFWDV